MKKTVPYKTIGRLSLYRRMLKLHAEQGARHIYSHELARLAGATAAQVRRDLMEVGAAGSSTKGYEIEQLIACLGVALDDVEGQRVALVGVGNLGRAVLTYFSGRRPRLSIVAAFDSDPYKTDRIICGCRCSRMERLTETVHSEKIALGIIAVPAAAAQQVADTMAAAGIKGILNFAPLPLKTPDDVYVEDIDMTMSLERVAYFARNPKAILPERGRAGAP